ncbi:hypothetical protein Pla175_50390 [Pirellulimonas nuda]|uniref:Uncharacterized protein n=1 Tax=Pirellulimonas nuda TaxID=2528009 RepID=A0A518DJE8_9BACT|nr:hypothetical protein [Pirellulimonas nuda]QDU91609.1 hypothetical protein Pla175_50390 [Pirellulimonas nuda]
MEFDFSPLTRLMESDQSLVDARNVLFGFAGDLPPQAAVIACYLSFGDIGAIVEAVREADSVSVHDVADLDKWVRARRERYVAEGLAPIEFTLSQEPNKLLRRQAGKKLLDYWACADETGIVDAIDLAFGDLLAPTDKILCVASSLVFLEVMRGDEPLPKKDRGRD